MQQTRARVADEMLAKRLKRKLARKESQATPPAVQGRPSSEKAAASASGGGAGAGAGAGADASNTGGRSPSMSNGASTLGATGGRPPTLDTTAHSNKRTVDLTPTPMRAVVSEHVLCVGVC